MFTTRPVLSGTFGMVASTHWLASAAGMATLEAGGAAADAAAAAGFVLHVVEPHLNGPGGDLPVLLATAADPRPTVLCAQGPVPAAATVARLRDELGLTLVPGTGPLAAVVPGAFGGWLALLRDHGRLPLREVLKYAIGYAEEGHPVLPRVAATIAASAELFRTHWPTSAERWLPAPAPGERWRQPALAATYRRLLAEAEAAGPDREAQLEAAHQAWYGGFVAEAIDTFAGREWMDDSGRPHAGLLTGADLAGWRPSYEPAVTLDWGGWTVAKPAAWSQGPVLLQQLALLDPADLPPAGSAELMHRAVEATKLAMADREAWYGDVPDVPLAELLGADYAAARRASIGADADLDAAARLARRPGAPAAGLRARRRGRRGTRLGPPGARRAHGRSGSGRPRRHLPRRRGRPVGHADLGHPVRRLAAERADDPGARLQPRHPGPDDLAAGRPGVHAPTPGRRPRTTLSPTLVLRDGEPVLACGTPGGDQQDQWQLCFLLAHLGHGLDLQAAIDAPAWHTNAFPASFAPRQAVPGEVVVEERVGPEVVAELRRRGHRVVVSDGWSLGRLSAVGRDPATGPLTAAANPRGMQGYAVGR